MMTTASLEPGPGEGWAEWRLAFVFSLRGPLPGNLASFSHTQLRLHMCCAGGSGMPGANSSLLLPRLSVAGDNTLWAERVAVSWRQGPASWWCGQQEGAAGGTDRTVD